MNSILSEDRTAVKLGSCCFGTPITLHFTFILLLAVEVVASLRYMYPSFSLYIFLLYGPVLFLTIVIVSKRWHLLRRIVFDGSDKLSFHHDFFSVSCSMNLAMFLLQKNSVSQLRLDVVLKW